MEEAAIRRSRTTFVNQLSATERAKTKPPEERHNATDRPGELTTLLKVIQEEEAAGRSSTEREQGRPMRLSLMTLLTLGERAQVEEFTDAVVLDGAGVQVSTGEEEEAATAEERMLCCVCLVRQKGTAFIPCGHTFCRLCSRELITARRSCPLCNECVLDILDIF